MADALVQPPLPPQAPAAPVVGPSANPRLVSSDYRLMMDFWRMVDAILDGVEGLRSVSARKGTQAVSGPAVPYASLTQLQMPRRGRTAAQSKYLPQFPYEQNVDYDLRRQNAPLTNIYQDISFNLASKPFSKKLELDQGSPDDLKTMTENIDGQGNNLHVFSAVAFKAGIDKGIDWIFIDYDRLPTPLNAAQERASGVRPYWCRIAAEQMLAVYSDVVKGEEVFVHARIHEQTTQRANNFEERQIERVRVLDRAPILDNTGKIVDYGPPTFTLYELSQVDATNKVKTETNWIVVDQGTFTIDVIPLVPFRTGPRVGNSWRVNPPLRDLAWMQIEEFQQESNLKSISEMTAFPMLAANGMQKPPNTQGEEIIIPVGPKAVLIAPAGVGGQSGSFNWIEPSGASLNFLQSKLDKFREEMRDLGMQPLASANLTVITTANLSMKAHNAVQAWALQLKDALEQAWVITCKWLNRSESIKVRVHTDFGVDFEAGTELQTLTTARANGDLSQVTYWDELKRRGVLSDDFDPKEEEKRLADEQQGLQPEIPIDPRTGLPLGISPRQATSQLQAAATGKDNPQLAAKAEAGQQKEAQTIQ